MREADLQRLLEEEAQALKQALPSFQKSLAKCASMSPSPRQSFEDEESFDALTSKFARISDIFTQKVLKTFVALLREDAPTFIDRMNLCEKLGIIPSAAQMIAVRDLRNTIAHEYATDDLMEVYRDTVALAPRLLEAINLAGERVRATLST